MGIENRGGERKTYRLLLLRRCHYRRQGSKYWLSQIQIHLQQQQCWKEQGSKNEKWREKKKRRKSEKVKRLTTKRQRIRLRTQENRWTVGFDFRIEEDIGIVGRVLSLNDSSELRKLGRFLTVDWVTFFDWVRIITWDRVTLGLCKVKRRSMRGELEGKDIEFGLDVRHGTS